VYLENFEVYVSDIKWLASGVYRIEFGYDLRHAVRRPGGSSDGTGTMKNIWLAWVCLLLAPVASRADGLATLSDARKVTDRAVALFAQEKFPEGYAALKPYWPLPAVEIDSLAHQTNMQWPIVRQRFGTSIATEFVKQVDGGPSFVRFIHLQKFQNHAIRWVFTFYKPKDQWIINSVSFDDKLETLFGS
jgi:hypothetical protein